jgi:hypothetical protein
MMKKIRIKNDWAEVTLEERLEREDIYSFEEYLPEGKTLYAISVLTGEDEETINNLPLQDFCSLAANLEFLKTTPQFKVPKSITINRHNYSIVSDLTKVTTAQYFDLCSLMKNRQVNKKEDLYNMIALFLIPEGKQYLQDYDIEDVEADVPKIPYAAVEGLISFFLKCRERFMKITVNYLLTQIPNKKQRMKIKKELKENKMTHTALLEMLAQSVK